MKVLYRDLQNNGDYSTEQPPLLFNLYSENDKILALIGDHLLIIYLKMYNTVLSPPYILWYILCLYLELFPFDTKY